MPWSTKDQVCFTYGGEVTLAWLKAKLALPMGAKLSLGLLKWLVSISLSKVVSPCLFFSNTSLPLFFLAVHYTPGPLNNLFGSAKGLDGNVSLQFLGQASLFSEKSTPDRDALIQTGDQRTMRSILTTAPLEDRDRKIYRKPDLCSRMRRPTRINSC